MYSCTYSFCDCKFNSEENLQYHLDCHNPNEDSFICPECIKLFKTWVLVKDHLIEKHEIEVESELEIINSAINGTDTNTSLLLNTDEFCKTVQYLCSFCGYVTKYKRLHEEHIRNHTGEKPYECQHCDYKTGRKHLLKIHYMIHSGEKKYKCPHCPYASISSANYKNHHKARHPGQDGIYLCTHCSYCSISEKCYQGHLLKKHNSEPDSILLKKEKAAKQSEFKCDKCNYKVCYKYLLEEHMRRHTGEKPFKCEFCVYRSSSKKVLKLHRMKHTGEMRYKCPYCSYKVISTTSYKKHFKLKHPGMSDTFTCNLCSYTTAVYSNYVNHACDEKIDFIKCETTENISQEIPIRIETSDPQQEVCPICGCPISDPNHYKKHTNQEKIRKRYQCNQCDYSTEKRARLKVHKMAHDGEKLCKCAYCSFITVYIETFRRHLKRKHAALKPIFICAVCDYKSDSHREFLTHINMHKKRYRISASPGLLKNAMTLPTPELSKNISQEPFEGSLCLEVWEEDDSESESNMTDNSVDRSTDDIPESRIQIAYDFKTNNSVDRSTDDDIPESRTQIAYDFKRSCDSIDIGVPYSVATCEDDNFCADVKTESTFLTCARDNNDGLKSNSSTEIDNGFLHKANYFWNKLDLPFIKKEKE